MTRIQITENDILEGDISSVAKVVDTLVQQPDQSKCEGAVILDFASMTFYTMAQRFRQPEYRNWFKKLDRECSNMLFYLSDESMLPYLMGNIDFSIDNDHKMTFNQESANTYIRGKKNSLVSFCIGNNIDPKKSTSRLMKIISTPEDASPQTQGSRADAEQGNSRHSKENEFFSKFPYSAKTTLKDGEMKIHLTLYLDNLPGGTSILGIYFVNRNVPQPYFCVVCGNNDVIRSFNCVLLSAENDFTQCLARKKEVTCIFGIRDELDNMVYYAQDYEYVEMLTKQESENKIELLKQNMTQQKAADTAPARQPEASTSQQEISEAMLGFGPDEVQEQPEEPEIKTPEPEAEPVQKAEEPAPEPERNAEKPAEVPVIPADETIARMEKRISELEKKVRQLAESNTFYLNELTRIQKWMDDISIKDFFELLYQKFFK